MTLRRRHVGNWMRVKGHAVDPHRIWAADWIRGALLVTWAIGVGTFIVAGGTQGFKSDTYQALITTFPCAKAIGATLIVGGLLGLVGTWADWRWMTKTSCVLCATWFGLLFGYTVPANWGAFGSSNLVSLLALGWCLMYVVQLIELWPKPSSEAVSR